MSSKFPVWLQAILDGEPSADDLKEIFPFAAAMIGCPHDPIYHGEGDPWVHTGMVAQELYADAGYRAATNEVKEILRLAVWFHDVAKPHTTVIEYDEELGRERVRQPGHAPLGAQMAWECLIDLGFDPVKARDVHALVFWHQRPTHLIKLKEVGTGEFGANGEEIRREMLVPNESNALKRIIQFSHDTSLIQWRDLITLCRADQLGRLTNGKQPSLDELEMAELYVEEQGENMGINLLHQPWLFENPASRLKFMRSQGSEGSPWFTAPEPEGSRVIVLSGLPGTGKNTLIRKHFSDLPTISFDDMRAELRMQHGDNQGKLIQAAFEQARVYLRAGQDFVWNATCLSRRARQKIVGLALDYGASVEIHALELPLDLARKRNLGRGDAAIPDKALCEMSKKREPAITDEAHRIYIYDADLNPRELFAERFAAPLPSGPTP